MYSASAVEVWSLFGDYVSGNSDAVVLAIGSRAASDAVRNALDKSFAALGYGNAPCAYAALHLPLESVQSVPLDAQALFMLVEGLDPVCLVGIDEEAIKALEGCYRSSFARDDIEHVFGRPAALFEDLDALLESDDGKQRAWRVLKALPRY